MADRSHPLSLMTALAILSVVVATTAPATPLVPNAPQLRPVSLPGLVLVWDDRVTETRDLPTWHLQKARRRMLAGQNISYDDMRALADLGDGLAAFRYANRLLDLDRPDVLSAAALYYATAAMTGRDYAIWPLIRLLRRDDIEYSDVRLRHLENVLRTLAESGNDSAATALMKFYESGHPFGPRTAEAADMQRERASAGDAEAALDLVMQLMSGRGALEVGPDEIDAWFATLATNGDPGQRATAVNMRRLYDADPTRYATAIPVALQEDMP